MLGPAFLFILTAGAWAVPPPPPLGAGLQIPPAADAAPSRGRAQGGVWLVVPPDGSEGLSPDGWASRPGRAVVAPQERVQHGKHGDQKVSLKLTRAKEARSQGLGDLSRGRVNSPLRLFEGEWLSSSKAASPVPFGPLGPQVKIACGKCTGSSALGGGGPNVSVTDTQAQMTEGRGRVPKALRPRGEVSEDPGRLGPAQTRPKHEP